MRRLLVVGFLLCSGTIAAQTDDRRVRTVQIDDGEVRTGPADKSRVPAPQRAGQSEGRRLRAPERAVNADERPLRPPGRAVQSDERPLRPLGRAVRSDERQDGAEQPDEHLALARRLVDLGPDSGAAAQSAAACVPEAETMRKDIAAAYRASPGEFHGISPQSAYWPEVEQAWHAYYVDRCAAQGDDSPTAMVARRYAANLSTDELREVLAFQESPSGRAFIDATRIARQDLENPPQGPNRRGADEASTGFRQAMQRLKAKYERAPK